MANRSGTLPKVAPGRSLLLYIEQDRESFATVEALVSTRKDTVLAHVRTLHLALELARSQRPEVMLINVDLVGLPARELVARLRAERALQAAPLLALAADATPAAITRSLEAGFFLCLGKPLQAEPFIEALDYALEFAAIERAEQL